MIVLLLILTAIICYILGNFSGSMVLSKFVFRKHTAKHCRAESPFLEFYKDFGAAGAVALVAFDVVKALLATLLGGLLLGIVDQPIVGRLFAAFCLLLGQAYPALFMFKGGHGLLCAGVAAFVVDWRVGLCCWVAYIVVIIFSRYAALGSVVAAILAPIFMWIFGFTGLEGTLALLGALIIVLKYAENIVRIVGGTEQRCFQFSGKSSDNVVDEEEEDY
jgi:glycerol-3-phosphate acyltransferase PlsY